MGLVSTSCSRSYTRRPAGSVYEAKGRKRHIFVETLGVWLAVVVTAARVQDREGAVSLLAHLRRRFSRMRLIWADQA
jgi:hypothetical protein